MFSYVTCLTLHTFEVTFVCMYSVFTKEFTFMICMRNFQGNFKISLPEIYYLELEASVSNKFNLNDIFLNVNLMSTGRTLQINIYGID